MGPIRVKRLLFRAQSRLSLITAAGGSFLCQSREECFVAPRFNVRQDDDEGHLDFNMNIFLIL